MLLISQMGMRKWRWEFPSHTTCGLNAEGESSFPSPTNLPPNHFASFGMQAKERNWLVKSGSQEMIWRSGWTPNRRFSGTEKTREGYNFRFLSISGQICTKELSRSRVYSSLTLEVMVASQDLSLGVGMEYRTRVSGWMAQLAILANLVIRSCFQVTGNLAFEILDCCIRVAKTVCQLAWIIL